MANAVDRFRFDLSEKVRRISRSPIHGSSIDEIVTHFEGILADESRKCDDSATVEREARRRIGSLHGIARQIVDTPGRVLTGIRIQKAMMICYTIATIVYFLATMGFWLHASPLTFAMEILVGCGFLMGIGCFMARRFAWKTMAVGMSLSIVAGMSYFALTTNSFVAKKESEQMIQIKPQVESVEEKFAGLFASSSTETFSKGLKDLESRVRSAGIGYFIADESQKGQYLYPAQFNRPTNLAYSIKLFRTNDLNTARSAYGYDSPLRRQWSVARAERIKSFEEWQQIYDHRNSLWMLSLGTVVRFALSTAALFLAMAGLGYMVGFVRLVGFDWAPIARKA